MIFKIYLIVSILAYLILMLSAYWIKIRYENINGKIDKSKIKKMGIGEKVMSNLRTIILCLIPIANIFYLAFFIYLFLFASDDFFKKSVFPKLDKELYESLILFKN